MHKPMFAAALSLLVASSVAAAPGDPWWDDGWPYRVEVTVAGSGVVSASIDFGATFAALGLNGAILDVRSLRVVPVTAGVPGAPISHAETYSTVLDTADAPQIGWAASGVYWTGNDATLTPDATHVDQGSGALKAVVDNLPGGYSYPGLELHIAAGDARTDWRPYEALIYSVWPQVNASALDQAPDLYFTKLYNTTGCSTSNITQGGPPVALDQWNRVSVSLDPFHTCTTPSFAAITRLELHTRDNDSVSGNSGFYDDGDQLTLWLDDLRLVDQDSGTVRFTANGSTTYQVYFDTLDHEGHPAPALASLGAPTLTATVGSAAAGGYLHKVTGATTGSLAIWSAPPTEKVLPTWLPPVATAPLQIAAARGEHEVVQLVVRAPSAQAAAVSVSAFTGAAGSIPASAVTLHRVDYVTLTQLSDHFGRLGAWPDPLYPLVPGAAVDLPAGANQPLWLTVRVPADAAGGDYQATVTIGAATVPLALTVWDFTLPAELHLASEWGFGWSEVVETWGGTSGGSPQACYWDLVDALYEDFADHRLTPKGVGWPAGLNYPGGVEYDCAGTLSPDAWGDWDFHTLAWQYLQGNDLDNGSGFPSFLIKGPSSNWPPDSRPSSFCGQARGTDPPGNAAYNSEWFQYWGAVGDYLGATADYAAKGYYHVVNEPQTESDYDIVAHLSQATHAAAPEVRIMVSEQVEPLIHSNPTYPGSHVDIWLPTISNYESEKSHVRQSAHGEEVWWYFLYGDRPPLPNPTVIDRSGIEARIVPWLAWLERVDGLLYYATTDWSTDPWSDPWFNDGNGDGFLFYPPPAGGVVASDPCQAESNRLVPSIRWELLREGMEDYEYLWLVAGGDPEIGVTNAADAVAADLVASRTRFSRVPTDLAAARAALADRLTGLFRDGFESGSTGDWSHAVP